MDGNADIGIPLDQFAAQWRTSGNELVGFSTDSREHFGKDQAIRDFPGERSGRGSGKSLGAMGASHRERPAIDRAFREACSLEDHLLANLLVHARHSDKDVGLHFRQGLHQLRNVRTIGQRHPEVEQREIHVPRGHMRERQKRHAHFFFRSEAECFHRTRDI